ncbi:pyridoxal phosphate-dependent transferase [Cladochytrium replicatum]|nr:pyridoxal phosphate-dependent transferase [Cladochytrium replicatum]
MSVTGQLAHVPQAPVDAIFGLTARFKADTDASKINLGVGAYRTNEGKPWILPVVKKAEATIFNDPTLDHEYLPIEGLKTFVDASVKLLLGADSPAIAEGKVAAVQTISGTGAVRTAAAFLAKFRKAPIYISKPTWGNHKSIMEDAGLTVIEHSYWDPATGGLAFGKMVSELREAPSGSIVLLHGCAHNPTGVDPTVEQWKEIAQLVKEKQHFPFFDCAYIGFATGSFDADAFAPRYFVSQGIDIVCAQSYAKNFGLYGERVGCLTVVTQSPEQKNAVQSQLMRIIRGMISNPPLYGARIVSIVLNDPQLYQEWVANVQEMAGRIKFMRQQLFDHLKALGTPGTWNHIINQIGMFSYTGLSTAQVNILIEKFHVYLTADGRISMAGLNTGNVKRFAESVDWVVRNAN